MIINPVLSLLGRNRILIDLTLEEGWTENDILNNGVFSITGEDTDDLPSVVSITKYAIGQFILTVNITNEGDLLTVSYEDSAVSFEETIELIFDDELNGDYYIYNVSPAVGTEALQASLISFEVARYDDYIDSNLTPTVTINEESVPAELIEITSLNDFVNYYVVNVPLQFGSQYSVTIEVV